MEDALPPDPAPAPEPTPEPAAVIAPSVPEVAAATLAPLPPLPPPPPIPPLPEVPAYADRSTGLVIFGVAQIILGLLAALMVPLMALGAFMSRLAPGGAMRPGQILSGVATYGFIAAVLLALGIVTLSMSGSSLLSVKESLQSLDLKAFRPFLDGLRRSSAGYASLREPIAAWARDHGLQA